MVFFGKPFKSDAHVVYVSHVYILFTTKWVPVHVRKPVDFFYQISQIDNISIREIHAADTTLVSPGQAEDLYDVLVSVAQRPSNDWRTTILFVDRIQLLQSIA
jgi:hypothetical protein